MLDKETEALRQDYIKNSGWSQKELSNNFKPGSLGFHEAFHMASVIGDIFERSVASHPVIISDKDLFKDANEIMEKIYNLYQKLGNMSEIEEKEDK